MWNHYRSNTMTVTAGARTFTGSVQGDQFVFDGGVRAFTKPSTRDVLFCDGALAAPNDGVTGPVAATLGAGFNRGVLTDTGAQPVADAGTYYRRSTSPTTTRGSCTRTPWTVRRTASPSTTCASTRPTSRTRHPTSMTVTITPF